MLYYLEQFLAKFFDCIDTIHLRLIDYLIMNVKAKFSTDNLAVLLSLNNYQEDLNELITFLQYFLFIRKKIFVRGF